MPKKMKLLVVDDRGVDRRLLRKILESKGHEVQEAADGQEGLDMLRLHKTDLIISDALMPGMDGFRFLRNINKDADLKGIPFVFYSAVYTGSNDEKLARSLGARAFIEKPASPEEFMEKLTTVIQQIGAKEYPTSVELIIDEEEYLSNYSDVVATKLEEKVAELEKANKRLQIEIKERKQAEAEVRLERNNARKSEKQWDRTFNSFTDIVTLQDTDLRIVKANQAACTTLGLTWDEIVGHHCHELFHDSKDPCQDCPLLEKKKTFKHYIREMHHEKLAKTFLVSASPVFDEQGQLEYIAHVAKDITELKQLEVKLFQSQKMEAIGTLAGGIAHDFNNILSGIIGCSELIQDEVSADSDVSEDIADVLALGKRAADLVKQILIFSRKTDSEKQPLRPHLIVKEALKMLRSTLPSTIYIEQNIDPDCGKILANPTNIHQITVNLCTNARYAMTDEKGTLGVSLQRQEISAAQSGETTLSAGSFVVLTVSDTGCGMDKTTMDRIFEPYFTTKEVGRGTGLGLAVVHGIVQDTQGFIRVKSTPGEGSSFAVYFPVLQEKTFTAHKSDQILSPQGGSEHILVVDDEPLLVRVTQRQLENLGYRVTGTTNSKDALEKIRTTPEQFDLLITDQTMPGLTGAELALAVKEIKPDLHVILCTGHSDLVSKEKALELGIEKYVLKPIAGDELFRAVRSVLDGK